MLQLSKPMTGFASLMIIGGSVFQVSCGLDSWSAVHESRSLTAAHIAASPISVQTRNGSITIASDAGGNSVMIAADVQAKDAARLALINIVVERDPAGVLHIRAAEPADGWQANDGCSFVISLPDAVGATAVTSNGAVQLKSLSGVAAVTTSNGSVTVSDHHGPVRIETSNGSVTVTDAHAEVVAATSNGSMRIALAPDSTGYADLRSSNGSVVLTVGSAFAGTLVAETSNGKISFPSGASSTVADGRGRMVIGNSPTQSSIRTSNGSVTVRLR